MRLPSGALRTLIGLATITGLVLPSALIQPEIEVVGPALSAQVDVTATPRPGQAPTRGPSDTLPPDLSEGSVGTRINEPFQCPPEFNPQQPVAAAPAATMFPLYQPPPWSTGEIVYVSNTGGAGANFRVAPRARARIWRIVPEGEPLETVGGDFQVDGVPWAYLRDSMGTVGWIAAHQLTTIAQLPSGRLPAIPRAPGFGPCPVATPTPTVGGIILIPVGTVVVAPGGAPGGPAAPGPGGRLGG